MAGPEVKVRLSAEGVQEVVSAFRRIQAESAAAGSKSAQAFRATSAAVSQLRSLLPAITAGAAIAGLKRLVTGTLEYADALDETAKSLGITTDFLQELNFAAASAGTPVESLGQALGFLERKIDDAAQKGEPLVQFLDGTSIAAKNADGSVRAVQEVFEEIVRVFPQVATGAEQAGFAADLFGAKIGTKMVPLLSAGSEGLAQLRQEAHDTGNVLERDLVEKGGRLNDELELLATRLKVAFAEGLLDVDTSDVETLHEIFTDPRLVSGVKEFGESVRSAFSFLVENGDEIKSVLLAAAGAFGGAFLGPGGAAVGGVAGFALGQALKGTTPAATLPPAERKVITGTPFNALAGSKTVVDPAAAAKAEAAQEKARRAAEAAARKAEAAREKAIREEEQLNEAKARALEATLEFEARLLEQQGKRHEAEMAALALELATYEANLTARGDLEEAEIKKRVAAAEAAGKQRADFAELQRQADDAFSSIAARRAEIEEQVARGQITEQAGQSQIIALDLERLGNLEAIAKAMVAIAEASKDPAQIQAARELATAIGQIRTEADRAGREWAEFRKELADAAEGELSTFFNDVVTGAESVGDAFDNMIKGIAKSFARLASDLAAKKIFELLLGGGDGGGLFSLFGGGATKKAFGGLVTGPGTGTSDSIPALLSNREYVVRASAVAQPGVREALDDLNFGRTLGLSLKPVRGPIRRYRDGGFVAPVTAGNGGAGSIGALKLSFSEDMMHMRVVDVLDAYLASEMYRK